MLISPRMLGAKLELVPIQAALAELTYEAERGNVRLLTGADHNTIEEAVASFLVRRDELMYLVKIRGPWAAEAPHLVYRLVRYLEHATGVRVEWLAASLAIEDHRTLAASHVALCVMPPKAFRASNDDPIARTLMELIRTNNANVSSRTARAGELK